MVIHTHRTEAAPPAPEWLSLQKAAVIYDVSVDTLRRSISTGRLPASRVGRRLIRVRVTDLERLYRPIPAVIELASWRQS